MCICSCELLNMHAIMHFTVYGLNIIHLYYLNIKLFLPTCMNNTPITPPEAERVPICCNKKNEIK